MPGIDRYTIESGDSILNALKKIDLNHQGFLIVLSDTGIVKGVLTDGDVRRYILQSHGIDGKVEEAYCAFFVSLKTTDNILKSIDLFKSEGIDFIPILDNNDKLVNIITKRKMQAILMQDMSMGIHNRLMDVDESCIDYEVFLKPWGIYKTTVLNNYFQSKIIIIHPKSRLSLQYHNKREEHWVVVHGLGIVQVGESKKTIKEGDYIYVPRGVKHRLENHDKAENLIITEIQIGDYLGEDDIIRIEDDYCRNSIYE